MPRPRTSDNPAATKRGDRWSRLLAGSFIATLLALTWSPGPTVAGFGSSLAAPRLMLLGRDQGVPFAALGGVAVDRVEGEIFVADAGRHEIVVYDTAGGMRGWFVHRVPDAQGRMSDGRPVWLAVDRNRHLLVSDEQVPWVDVVDFRGRSLARLSVPADSAAGGAGAIAVAGDGTIFVASRGDHGRVHRFGPDYAYQTSWGVAGADSGQIGNITGIAVGTDGRVHLTCALTRLAVQAFDPDGRFIGGFGLHDLGDGSFSMPSGVAATGDGRLWVVDQIRQVVQVFDTAGRYVGMVGGMGSAPGEFRFPSALASDGGGLLVVAERVGNRVQVWRTR